MYDGNGVCFSFFVNFWCLVGGYEKGGNGGFGGVLDVVYCFDVCFII